MTAPTQENQVQNQPNDKELNFRKLEERYQRQLEQERAARLEAERLAQEYASKQQQPEEENDTDPYVDHKKLDKKLTKFGQSTQSEIQKAMEIAKVKAKEEIKQEMWLEGNPDFYDVLQNHSEKFAQKAPKMAETILRMPEGFERQKLVYQTIKELGIDKPEQKQSTIQEKVDANRRSPYYQPSGVGSAPYAAAGDFSASGQKNAYAKMQELKKQLRI
jgi:hypothetical protein